MRHGRDMFVSPLSVYFLLRSVAISSSSSFSLSQLLFSQKVGIGLCRLPELTLSSPSQKRCVAKLEAICPSSGGSHSLKSIISLSGFPFLRLSLLQRPQICSRPLPPPQTKLNNLQQSTFLAEAWIFFFLYSFVLVSTFISFHLEDIFYYSYKMGKPFNPPAFFQPICLNSFVLKLFERIMLSRLFFFRESNSIPSPRRAGFRLVGLFSIQFCSFLSSFRMSLTSTARAHGRFLPRSTFSKLSTLSGIHRFSTNLFWLALFLALHIELNFSFLISALVWLFKITKIAPFEPVEVFCVLYLSLFLSMIFLRLCLPLSAALLVLTIWPFVPSSLQSLLLWRLYKVLSFNWSASLNTGVFLSIRENVRPISRWISNKQLPAPPSYSTAPFPSLQLHSNFLGINFKPHSFVFLRTTHLR